MKRSFTLGELEVYWEEYESAFRLWVLKDGKRELRKLTDRPAGCTSAEKVKLKSHMTFPEFLKEATNA